MNFLAQRRTHFLQKTDKHSSRVRPETATANTVNIARLAGMGTWRVDFMEKTTFFDAQTRKLLNTPPDFRPSLHRLDQFYYEDFREKAIQVYYECREGNPFSVESKMMDFHQREFWGRITGEPIYNDKKQVVGITGIFQDITAMKEQELHLKLTVAQLRNQNDSLQGFAKITTHNLRSLANNLQLSLELLRGTDSKNEQDELLVGLGQISENFSTTIHHLNKVLAIQSKARAEKEEVTFRDVMESVLHTEHHRITETDAEVYSDFSELPSIAYHAEYLEFILRELLVNALTYRHPKRKPEINIYTTLENDKRLLTVKDNGMGMDLEKNGNRLFQLYQTFHDRPEAGGIGLFLVRTKVEAMLGSIEVQSTPDKGTTFTVIF